MPLVVPPVPSQQPPAPHHPPGHDPVPERGVRGGAALSRDVRRAASGRGTAPRLAAVGLAAGLVLAGCGGVAPESGTAPTTPPAARGTTSAAPDAFPLTIENCGVEVTVDERPERVVAIKSSMIELVLALGAGDRLAGTGFPDGPAPEPWADEAAAVPVLSDKVPSAETVLETEPDLVMAGWESNLTGEGAGDRATLAGLGVATYVAPSACTDPTQRPDRLTFDDVFAHVEEAGRLLGATDAAARLVAEQRERLAAVERDDRGLTALWWSSGTDVPFVGAGSGAPQMIMEAVGLVNTAAGLDETWSPWSWEQVAADDPDVLVLVDSEWNSADRKKALLAEHPVLSELTAVREERFLVVPFPATEAGVRNVAAVEDLARQLAGLDLG